MAQGEITSGDKKVKRVDSSRENVAIEKDRCLLNWGAC